MKVELKDKERIDDLQRNGYQIIQNPEKFCFGMDAVLLTGFANARDVRNFFEFALTNQADRLAKLPEPLSDEELLTLLPEDVQSIPVA